MVNTVSDDRSLKTTLEGFSPQQVESLTHAATYYRTLRSLHTLAWITLGLSLGVMSFIGLALVLPALITYPVSFTFVQICLNGLAIVLSLWILLKSRLSSLLILSFGLLICACWNVATIFYGDFDLFKSILGLFGFFQLGYAFQAYGIGRNLSELQPSSLFPEPQVKQQYDSIWKAMVKANAKTALDCSRLEVVPNQSLWQSFLHGNKPVVTFLLFLPSYAVLAYKDRKWLRFVPKADFVLEIGEGYKFSESQSATVAVNNNANSNFKISVFVRLSDEVLRGQISAKDFQQYIDWKKLTAEQLQNPEAFVPERLSHNRKRTIKSAAVLLYFFIAAILVIYVMQHLPQS